MLVAAASFALGCGGDATTAPPPPPPGPPPVASVAVSPSTATLTPGDTVRLVATPKDSTGTALTDRPVSWTSSDTSIATVSGAGLVTARTAGSATVTATSEGQPGTARLTVSPTSVASVAVTPDSVTLVPGDTVRLTATPEDSSGAALAGRTIAWTSSDTSVATVDPTGLVTARAVGTAAITATAGGRHAATHLTVDATPVARVALSPAGDTLLAGDTLRLTATTLSAAGDTLHNRPTAWTSSDTSVATIDAAGLVTARAEGSAVITATSEGQQGTATIAVRPAPVARVVLAPDSAALVAGDTLRLAATVLDAHGDTLTGRAIVWTSSDTAIATVDTTGLVATRATGTVTITATSEGQHGQATLDVSAAPVAQVVVSPASGMVILGNALQLAATVTDARGDTLTDRPVTWTSSDTTIATVSAAGVVTPHVADTVTITATAEGQSGSAALRVAVRFAQLDAGSSQPSASIHTCGLTTTGGVYCWGQNRDGVLGDGTTTSRSVPVTAPGAPVFAQLIDGNDYTCALDPNGRAYCWGSNSYGQLGDGTFTAHAAPKAVAGNLSFSKLFAGDSYVCGLISGGAAYCWGRNSRGQLGDGSTTSEATPTAVHGNPSLGTFAYTTLALGGQTSCGLTGSGAAYCWGDGLNGQLGLGVAAEYMFPVPVAGNHSFSQLSTSGQHTCGVTTSGAAYCWGWNVYGQLGDGTTTDSATSPVLVGGGHTFARVKAAQGYTCGLTPTGAAYCWGNNASGQLGDGAVGGSSGVPVAVAGGLTFTTLGTFSADNLHSLVCGLTTGGTAYCWGDNRYGQLGDGTTTGRGTPAPVSGGLTFTQLRVGFERACGLTSANIAYCWGSNAYGQLGDGSTANRNVPTLVAKQP